MRPRIGKIGHFMWRTLRNLACYVPVTRRYVLPGGDLATSFGRDDAAYAWMIYHHHCRLLTAAGFRGARRTLEIGPGRNIGTGLLWWASNRNASAQDVEVLLWDVYQNTIVDPDTTWRKTARELLRWHDSQASGSVSVDPGTLYLLRQVAAGEVVPGIDYQVSSFDDLLTRGKAMPFDLILSHAALEHVWEIERMWKGIGLMSSVDGWQSHRIDLADHGRRTTNYLEMLEWSQPAYWATMRFVPGATNRMRAQQHIDTLAAQGVTIVRADREVRDSLPVLRSRLHASFREFSEMELRTTALDLIGRRAMLPKSMTPVLRIVMFCPAFRPIIGGAERQAEKLANTLAGRGVQVEVWTPKLEDVSPFRESSAAVEINRFPLLDLSQRFPWIPKIGIVNAPLLVLQILRATWRALGRADVVHCHIGSLPSVAAGVGARIRGTPVICKAAVASGRSDIGEMEKSSAGRLAARLAPRVFTRWIATTNAVRDGLHTAGVAEARIVLIPNGVIVPPYVRRASPSRIQHILYLGRLSSNINRDVLTLLTAFDEVAPSFPEIALAIVGDGDQYEETAQAARRLTAGARVILPGAGDAEQWLQWADVFVLPSRREGLSNALLEAMAAGLPCIANDIPPNREVLADGKVGVLVPVGDAAALRDALRADIENPEAAVLRGKLAHDRVAQAYSIENTASAYTDLYALLVTNRRAPSRNRAS